MTNSVSAYAPATVANVCCAFDVLGFAVDKPGDIVTVSKTDSPKNISIKSITGDNGKLPLDPKKNTASVAVQEFLNFLKIDTGISITIDKKMPLGSGLGSSAASSVAALFAINELFNKPLSREELLPFAIKAESIACGAAHADNVAPALFGGFILIRNNSPLDITQIPSPENLYSSIVHPKIEVNTRDARKILKQEIPLTKATKQWANIAGLIAGLYRSDYDLISRSLEDHIFEEHRKILIPGFDKIKKKALQSGALGCGISGSGPSVFALSTSEKEANKIAKNMSLAFTEEGVESNSFVSKINNTGPKILKTI